MTATEVSDKLRLPALAIGALTGFAGGHRFYVGKVGTGILQLCTLGGLGLWWLVDLILIGSGEFRDVHGRRLARWTSDDEVPAPGGRPARDPQLLQEVEQLRSEMFDLQERVDFLERTLTRERERPRVPPGS
jgi:hypothetical protein